MVEKTVFLFEKIDNRNKLKEKNTKKNLKNNAKIIVQVIYLINC